MGPIYQRSGCRGVRPGRHAPAGARRAYAADVTYVTAKEAGFDHLRDLLARTRDDVVHRPFQFALIDEADSILIDEAACRSSSPDRPTRGVVFAAGARIVAG
jgi:preprotein translocase subunit SecA